MAVPRKKSYEPIAVVGLGCRFPGDSNSLEEFWSVFRDAVDTVTEIPEDRWDVPSTYDPTRQDTSKIYSRAGSFLKNIDKFDAQFFNISATEAQALDPQQRIMLEVCWEALEHAGIAPGSLGKTRTGVYFGVAASDYFKLLERAKDKESIASLRWTGTAQSMAVGRISYSLGLRGPAMAIDTTCSSSLVAVHLACKSLQDGEADLALAGGSNLMLAPDVFVTLCQIGAISPTGKCRSFDETGDGIVRSEGCGVVVLKKLSRAIEDRDNILAVVRATAINHDGASASLTAPNVESQEILLREALALADLPPSSVAYLEAHGTGTPLGDPIEVQALASVYGQGRTPETPLFLGSSKANLGHAEYAAGIVGFIKLILVLSKGIIPKQINFKKINPHMIDDMTNLSIPMDLTPWPTYASKRVGAVSSFGLSGTNAHAIVESPSLAKAPEAPERKNQILTLAARNRSALISLIDGYAKHLGNEESKFQTLAEISYTAGVGRTHFSDRASFVSDSKEALLKKLEAASKGNTTFQGFSISPEVVDKRAMKTAFLFSGAGSQRVGMGKGLYLSEPVFRAELDRCAGYLKGELSHDLHDLIWGDHVAELDSVVNMQAAVFSIGYSLSKLWESWGIVPAALIGHSLGECIMAAFADIFTLEDGLRLVIHRARAMDSAKAGLTAFISAPEEIVKPLIEERFGGVGIAAINGPDNTVISGDTDSINEVVRALKEAGFRTKILQIRYAAHSPLMDPVLKTFEKAASAIKFNTPRPGIGIVSGHTGKLIQGREASCVEYWIRNVRDAVRFADGMSSLYSFGCRHFIEIGSQSILSGMGQACLQQEEITDNWYPSLTKNQPEEIQILESVGRLYANGHDIDWEAFYRPYRQRKVPLPLYPFQRKTYWIETYGKESSDLKTSSAPVVQGEKDPNLLDYLMEATANQRREFFERFVNTEMARELGFETAEKIRVDQTLTEMGIDSLSAIRIRNRWRKTFGSTITIPNGIVFQYPTIAALSEYLYRTYSGTGEAVETAIHGEGQIDPKISQPRFRIICFPHAGGGSTAFSKWRSCLSEGVELLVLHPPGRESRQSEPFPREFDDLINGYVESLSSKLDQPFIFFGHSIGCIYAFEVARRLRQQHKRMPIHIIVSSSASPPSITSHFSKYQDPLGYDFADTVMNKLGGVPRYILDDTETRDAVFGEVAREFVLARSYVYERQNPLDVPVFGIVGNEDKIVSRDDLRGWAQESTKFDMTTVDGGHFYWFGRETELIAKIETLIQQGILQNPIRKTAAT